jgi:hypothetical protein
MRDDHPIYLDVFDPPATNSMHYRIQLGKDLVLRNISLFWNSTLIISKKRSLELLFSCVMLPNTTVFLI